MRQSKGSKKSANPLTKLREQLAGPESKPVSMEKIARYANVPSATLRAVELGRRKFSPEIWGRMRQAGLEWDADAEQWFFTYDHAAELNLYLLESFRRLSRGDDGSQDHDVHVACEKVISLLHEVSVVDYSSLLLDLNASLERLRETYRVEGSRELFKKRALKYEVLPTKSGGQMLVKTFSWDKVPEGLLDFRHERKVRDRVDEKQHAAPHVVPSAA